MQHGIFSFPCNVLFMNSFRHWLYSVSCGMMGFNNTTESGLCFRCLGFFCFWSNGFPYACLRERSCAWHCRCLWYFQLSSCILNDVCVFFVTRINRINSSQFSGMFKFWFLDCPFLFFSSLSGFSNSCDLDVMSSGFLAVSPPDRMYPFGGVSFSNVNLVKPVHESDRFRFPSTFQWSSTRFSCATSKSVWVDLITSMYFRGIGNDSSWSTKNWTLGSIWWRWMKSPWIDQKSFRASASSFVSSGSTFPYRHEILRWDSLSLRWVPVSERVLGIRSLFMIMLLNHLPQEIQILRLCRLSGLLLHSVFCEKFLMRPTFPTLRNLQSVYLLSKSPAIGS